jgi:hypothetical protein
VNHVLPPCPSPPHHLLRRVIRRQSPHWYQQAQPWSSRCLLRPRPRPSWAGSSPAFYFLRKKAAKLGEKKKKKKSDDEPKKEKAKEGDDGEKKKKKAKKSGD